MKRDTILILEQDDASRKMLVDLFKNKYKIDTDTIKYIMSCCGDNYDLVYNELNKIFLYYNEPTIIILNL